MDARFLGANIKMLQLFQHRDSPTSQLKVLSFHDPEYPGAGSRPLPLLHLRPLENHRQVGRRGFPSGLAVMSLTAVQESQVQSLLQGREDPLEKEMEIRSSVLAWRIPWMGEPGGLQSLGSQRVKHD